MLVIRLSRKGRKKQASYRLVVAEKSAPVKSNYVEEIGTYNVSEGKKLVFKKDRLEYWLSVGAQPSDTVAGLLNFKGIPGMEKFMSARNKKRPVKNPKEEPEAPAAEAPAEEAA